MNIYIALDLFAAIILIYWVIIDFFTMLFRFTGLPEEKARFQVMSILTGCGFTTDESELITAAKPRRRMALATMLFGYVFNITIVSAFINVFLTLKLAQKENMVLWMLAPLGLIVVLFILMRIPKIHAWEDRQFEKLAGRLLNQSAVNTVMLLDHIGTDYIAQVTLREMPEYLQDKPLAETGLRPDHNILIMLVERNGGKPEPPTGETVLKSGDKLTVFGGFKTICDAFDAKEQFSVSEEG